MVDDGSTDNCPQICDEWAKKDDRIKVIHKQNAGLGMARNTGIENATGEYICFFDSDDYVDLSTIEKAYLQITSENADIVVFGFKRVNYRGKVIKEYIPKSLQKTYSNNDVVDRFLPNLISNDRIEMENIWMSACMCLFSMNLIKRTGWRFVSEREIISEDVYSLLDLYCAVKKVTVLNEAFYYYCENATSLTQIYRADRYEKIKIFHIKSLNLCEKKGYSEEIKRRLSKQYISFTVAALKQICTSDLKRNDKKKYCYNILKEEYFNNILKEVDDRFYSTRLQVLFILIKFKMYTIAYYLIYAKSRLG